MEPYQRLEQELAEWSGMEYMVACSSGTAALHLALEAMKLPLGSKVIVPDYTMVACPRAVELAGLEPVFVDCDERLLMLPESVQEATRGWSSGVVILVHVYGRQSTWSSRTGLYVIEDMAEMHGVRPHPNTDAACYSFYRNKIVHGEEGGAVGFRNKKHTDLARSLRSLGFTEKHDFQHIPRGHNYRMSNAHARLVLNSLHNEKYEVMVRRSNELLYEHTCPEEWKQPPRDSPWVYDFRIPELTRERQDRIVQELNEAGIAARHGFKPMTTQEEFRDEKTWGRWVCYFTKNNPNAVKAGREVIYLPLTSYHPEAFTIVQRVLRGT